MASSRKDIIVLSSDDDEIPPRPTIRAGQKRANFKPGGEQRDANAKRPRLSDSNTTVSAPSGLLSNGMSRDVSSSHQRPTHRPSASSSSLQQSPKRQTVQRTISAAFADVPRRSSFSNNQRRESSSSGHKESSSDDGLPPSSSAFTDLFKVRAPEGGKQTGANKGSSRSVSGNLSQSQTSRFRFSGDKSKEPSSSMGSSISAPIRKSSYPRPDVIEVPDSDDETSKPKFKSKPFAPLKVKHKLVHSSSSTSNSTSSASGSRSNGPPSTIKPTSKPKSIPKTPPKARPSVSKPKPKPATFSKDPDVIFIDISDDELLLSPKKLPPKDSLESVIPTRLPALNIGDTIAPGTPKPKPAPAPSTKDVLKQAGSSMKPSPAPSEARITSTAVMRAQRKETETSASSTPVTRTSSNDSSSSGRQPLIDLRSLSIGKKKSPPSSSASNTVHRKAEQPPVGSGSVTAPATVGSLASELALVHGGQAKDEPASGTPNTAPVSTTPLPTSTPPPPASDRLPFGKATLLRSPPKAAPSSPGSTSDYTPAVQKSPNALTAIWIQAAPQRAYSSAASSSSDVSSGSGLKEIPAISTARPAHSRKSSSEVRKDLTGIQDAIGTMGLESSSTAKTNARDPKLGTKPSKSTSAADSDIDIDIPDSLPPISLPSWAPARSSAPSTPTRNRPVIASQAKATVSPIRYSKPSSPAATAIRKASKPGSPTVGSGSARSGGLMLEDILDQSAPLTKAPVLVSAGSPAPPSSSEQRSPTTTPVTAPAVQPTASSNTTRRPALPSRSSLGLIGTSNVHQPLGGPLSWNPKETEGDTVDTSSADAARTAEQGSTRGPFSWNPQGNVSETVNILREAMRKRGLASTQGPLSWAPKTRDGDVVDATAVETVRTTEPTDSSTKPSTSAQDMTTLGTNDPFLSRTSSIISGVLDMPVHQQAPMAAPMIVPGHETRSSDTYEVSSPPLPFLRDASSPLSQSDPGPPSSRSPSAPHSSPDMGALTEMGDTGPASSSGTIRRREPVPASSSPPGQTESSNESSAERSHRIPISQRIARKTARRHTIPMPPAIRSQEETTSAKPRKSIARKTMGHRVPSPLKQVAPEIDHDSEYNAATSSSGDEASQEREGRSSGQRRTRKTRNLVQSDSDSEAAVHQSLVDDQPIAMSSNDEPVSSEAEGSRRRPRRAAAKKKISYYIPMEDEQLPSSEGETNPAPDTPAAEAYSDDEDDDVPIPVKTYGGFQVSSWAAYRKDLSNFSIKTRFSRDLSTRLQDQINSWPEYMKQQKTLTTIFKAAIVEHTAEDEPFAPQIDVINTFDLEPTPPWEFYYSNHMWYGEGVAPPDLTKLRSCGCVGRCDPNSDKCACVRRQRVYMPDGDRGFFYDTKGKVKSTQWPIFECNKLCGCDEDCQNRVVQNGRKVSINIQKTENKGWGVFAGPKKIPMGTFIGIYAGELITNEEGNIRGKDYDKFGRTYLFDIDFWHLQKRDAKGKILDDVKYTVDAFHAGNFTRFLNHHCEPNCVLVPVYIDEPDIEKPLLVLFSSKDIKPLEEICFSYYGDGGDDEEGSNDEELEELADNTENDAVFLTECKCGAPSCKGRLWRA